MGKARTETERTNEFGGTRSLRLIPAHRLTGPGIHPSLSLEDPIRYYLHHGESFSYWSVSHSLNASAWCRNLC